MTSPRGATAWFTQKQMSALFDENVRTINQYVKNIFREGGLAEDSVIRKFRIVPQEGSRQVRRAIDHYSLNEQGLTALTLLISFPCVTKPAQGVSTIKTPFPGDGGPLGSLNASGSASSG